MPSAKRVISDNNAADLFAGFPVKNYSTSLVWYEKLLGYPPAFLPNNIEAVWELAEHRYFYIKVLPEHAGNALNLVFLSDLDGFVGQVYGKETAYKEAGSEFLNCRVIGVGRTWKPELRQFPEGPKKAYPALMAFREIYSPYSGRILSASIYDGSKLQNGMVVEGPAIIERTDTTVFVVPNSTVRVDKYNNFILELL